MVGGYVPGFGRIVWIGETYLEGGTEVEFENGIRVEVFPDAFGEPQFFAWDRNNADKPVKMELSEVNKIVKAALEVCDDEFARKWLEKWLEAIGEEEVEEMADLFVNVEGDFFEGTRKVTTSVPLKDAVSFSDLFTEAGRKVFEEGSYESLLEDLYLSYDDPEEAWPEGSLLPRYPPKDEWAREIYEKRRAQVLEYARLIKQYLQQGYKVVTAKKSDEKQPYEYSKPTANWTYKLDRKGEVRLLALFNEPAQGDDAGQKNVEVGKMVRKVFVNLTAHDLLPEQVDRAKEEFGVEEFIGAKDVLPAGVVQNLRQCPSDPEELTRLAYTVADGLVEFARRKKAHLYVHLPVGSPAFMWVFAQVFPYAYATPVFSHTRRVVEEFRNLDGTVTKKSVFLFERFIVEKSL